MNSKGNSSKSKSTKNLKEKEKRNYLEEKRLLHRETSTNKQTKNFLRFKPRLLLKKKMKIEESKSMPKRERPLSTLKNKRKQKDSQTSRILGSN